MKENIESYLNIFFQRFHIVQPLVNTDCSVFICWLLHNIWLLGSDGAHGSKMENQCLCYLKAQSSDYVEK